MFGVCFCVGKTKHVFFTQVKALVQKGGMFSIYLSNFSSNPDFPFQISSEWDLKLLT